MRAQLSLRLSGQGEAVGVMKDAVENGVRMSRSGELGKPIGHRKLRSQQERGAAETIIYDFQQITSFCRGNGIAQPVVENEQW